MTDGRSENMSEMLMLNKPFKTDEVEWRIQRSGVKNGKPWAMVLCYVQNRAIMKRLDEVFGCMGWQNTYKEWHGNSQLCGISAWDKDKKEWITKWDGADATNIEATKGGLSDSMKRAAVQWGIGRYLYDLEATFAECTTERPRDKKAWNQAYDKESKTTFYWKNPDLPKWAVAE